MVFFSKRTQSWNEYIHVPKVTDINEVDKSSSDQLSFLGIDQETLSRAREAKNSILSHNDQIIDNFIDRIQSIDHLNNLLLEPNSVHALRQTIGVYIDQFFEGKIDHKYIESRKAIGHKIRQVQLTLDFFLSAHHLLIHSWTLILMQNMRRVPDQMIKVVHAVQKLAAFDQQLIASAYMGDTSKSFLFNITDLLNETIQVETIKQLIDKTDEQIQESHNVSAAMEEMSSTIEEVANHANRVAEGSKLAVQSADRSKEVIGDALSNIEQVGDVYHHLDEQVNELRREIEHTQNIANVIEEISAQTNLLALNASIEAARAGEQGRGFTVVAEEVRKLSDNTKEQIEKITSNLNNLQNVSTQLIQKIEHTGDQVSQSVSSAKLAGEALTEIINYIEENSASTNQIAAMTEEQSAVAVDISARNATILDHGLETQSIAKETATMIYDLSSKIDEYRKNLLNINLKLNSSDLTRVAKTDHLLWKWKVYNMLLGVHSLDFQQAISYQDCRLGKWYYGSLPSAIKNIPSYIELEEPHMQVHQHAAKAIEYYENNKLAEAEQQLIYLEQASKKVIALLTKLEKDLVSSTRG